MEEISNRLHLYLGHLLPLSVTVTISCSQGQVSAQCLAMGVPHPSLRMGVGVMGHCCGDTGMVLMQHHPLWASSSLADTALLGHVRDTHSCGITLLETGID